MGVSSEKKNLDSWFYTEVFYLIYNYINNTYTIYSEWNRWQKNITANFEISIGIGTRIPKGTTVQNLKRTCNILGNTYITDNENNEINLASKDVYE